MAMESTSGSAAQAYRDTYTVRAYESTAEGVASVQAICNYLQETAGNHSRRLGFSIEQLTKMGLTWMLARLRLRLTAMPRWREAVDIETWPSGSDGLRALRDFLIYDSGAFIGRATSLWLPRDLLIDASGAVTRRATRLCLAIDLQRRRPTRLPVFISATVAEGIEPAVEHDFPSLDVPDEYEHAAEFNVRHSDLDMNRHVNNVRYVEWALESLPLELADAYSLAELDVQFKAETYAGDRVRATAARESDDGHQVSYLHRVVALKDNREVAVLRTTWRR